MQVAPRPLLLNLLLGAEGQALSAREAVECCALFGIQENSARVTLARLSAAGLLVAESRGRYALGPAALALAADVSHWREAEQRLRDWQGDWIAVHAGAAGRSDRSALRARERAVGLLGLAEFERGLYLRPDNLVGGGDAVRERLQRLGAGEGLTVFVARGFEPAREAQARALWDGAALDARYRAGRVRLDDWLARAEDLSLEQAARESFLIGNDAIREIVFDPWLPAPLVDAGARTAYLAAVRRFDSAGQAIWQRFLAGLRAGAPATLAA